MENLKEAMEFFDKLKPGGGQASGAGNLRENIRKQEPDQI